MELPQLTFKFEDSPHRDTLVLPLGKDVGADALGSLKLQFHSQITKVRDYITFFAVLESDNGISLLYVPEKQYAHLPNARSALKTILKNIGVDTNLACALKFMDLNTLIDFGIFRSDKKKEGKLFVNKKHKDLPLTIDNVDLEAEEPYDAREEYDHKVEIGLCDHGGYHYLHMLKHIPASEQVDPPLGWVRPFDANEPDVTPPAWELQVEQGSGLESQMKALALEDEPADSERKVSIPASKGRRKHEDLETQTVDGPKVHVLDIAQHTTFDGVLYILKAKTSKTRGEQEWVETLTNAMEEKKQGSHATLEEIYDTASELMDQGALPEVDRDPNPDRKRGLAVHRCRESLDLLDKTISMRAKSTWEAMTNAEFERACRNIATKHGKKGSQSEGHTCTQCTKPAYACTHYLVTGDAWTWKPISELTNEKAKHVEIFCSLRCERKWQEVLICPDCNTYDFTKTTGPPSYPSPKEMLDMTAQYLQRQSLKKPQKVENTEESRMEWAAFQRAILRGDDAPVQIVPEKTIKMWHREPRRVDVAICVTCATAMLPRNPMAHHLSMSRVCC